MVTITLFNANDARIHPITVEAQIDAGQWFFCLPEPIAHQLNLSQVDERELITSESKSQRCPYVGPIAVHLQDRTCFTGAIVYGEAVRLGAPVMAELALGSLPNPTSGVIALSYTENELVQSLTLQTAHVDELAGKTKRGVAKGLLSHIKADVQVSDEESRQSALDAKHDKK